MTERITLDYANLKEEDRRFLLNRNLSEVIANNSASISNTSMTLSLLAIALSGFSLVYQTKILWIILIYSAAAIMGLAFFLTKYKMAQNSLALKHQRLKINYDELFKYHLSYATNRVQ